MAALPAAAMASYRLEMEHVPEPSDVVAPAARLHGAALEQAPEVLVLCTGNAARSVMAGTMLVHLTDALGIPLRVTTAGTHAVDGQPMGRRTAQALATIEELSGLGLGGHRSRQLTAGDVARATLVIAMEADHVRYVRRTHPEAAARTGTLRRLCGELVPGEEPLANRVAALDLAAAELGGDEDVEDPAGGDDDAYVACAAELWERCRELVSRL